jgi:hypothetical protein
MVLQIGFAGSAEAQTSPQSITLKGRVMKPDGNPLEDASVQFTVQILSPNSEECVLYEEKHTIGMANTSGLFALSLGTGIRSGANFKDTSSLRQIFNNASAAITSLNCASGTSYTPLASHSRKIRLAFTDSAGVHTITQDQTVQTVPYALYADSLQGKLPGDFVQVNSTVALTQANLESVFASAANVTELLALISGTSTSFGGGVATGITSTGLLTLAAGGANNNVLLTPTGTGVVTTAAPFAITNSTASSSASTGSVVVAGGIGVGGDINSGGSVNSTSSYKLGGTNIISTVSAVDTTGMSLAVGQGVLVNISHSAGNEGWYNTGLGFNTLNLTTTGWGNTAIGSQTLENNTTGIYNTAIGRRAMRSNTTGSYNVALANGLALNTTGDLNISIGLNSLSKNTTGSTNTAIGYGAMVENQYSSENVAIGRSALYNVKPVAAEDGNNTAVGNEAGAYVTTGKDNTFLGRAAGTQVTTGNNNIIIGKQPVNIFAADNNKLNIGDLI